MNSVFNIRWPDTDLVSRLKVLALANRRSLQAEVLVALERHVALVLPAVAPEALVEAEGHRAQGDPATGLVSPSGDIVGLIEQPSVSTSDPRPSAVQMARRPFKSDFK